MWQTRVLYLLFLIKILQVDQVLCREGKTSKSSSDDESFGSLGKVPSPEDAIAGGHHIATKAHDNVTINDITHGRHHTSADNSTTPKTPSRLTNSTSISKTSAASNSTSGLSPTTGSPSLSLNRTVIGMHVTTESFVRSTTPVSTHSKNSTSESFEGSSNPSKLENSTSISNTSAGSANSTSGLGSTTGTGSSSLSLNTSVTSTSVEHDGIHVSTESSEDLTTQATIAPPTTSSTLKTTAHSTVSVHPTVRNVSSSLSGLGNRSRGLHPTEHSHSTSQKSSGTSMNDSVRNSTTNGSISSSHVHSTTIPSIIHAHNTSKTIEHGSSNSGINSTKIGELTSSSSGNSTTQIPSNSTTNSAHEDSIPSTSHGHNTSIHHVNSTKSPHTGNPKDSTRISKHLTSSSQNLTTKSLESNRTSPNPSDVTSTAAPISRTTSASIRKSKSTQNSTAAPGESLETIKSMKFEKEEHFKSGDSVITEVEFKEVKKSSSRVDSSQYESSLAPLKLALARDAMKGHTMRKDSRDIHGSTGMLNSTSPGGNSTALANSTVAHNLTATVHANSTGTLLHNSTGHGHLNATASTLLHNSTVDRNSTASTLLHNSTLPGNSTESTLLHNSTLHANSTASTPLHNSTLHANSTHCNSTLNGKLTTNLQPNCKINHNDTSPSPPSKEPQVLKITSETVFNYMINNSDTGIPCLLANMSIDLKALYAKSDQTISRGNLHVPSTAKSNGTCTGRHAQLTLIWKEKGKSKVKRATANSSNTLDHEEDDILIFEFINDGKRSKLDKIRALIVLDAEHFPNSSAKTLKGESKSGLGLFSSRVDATAYVCNAPTQVKAGDFDISITNIALIAFNSKKDLSSIKVESCQAHTGLNIGAVIGGFIVVALIISIGLYLIAWRKKNSYRSSQIP